MSETGEPRTPALTFDDIEPDRIPVELFGERYEMAANPDLSLRQRARIQRLTERVGNVIGGDGECSDEEADAAEAALAELLSIMVPEASAEVMGRLKTGERLAMLNLFTGASAVELVEALRTLPTPNRSTGDQSSPASSSASDTPGEADG